MFRCLIRNCLGLVLALSLSAGAVSGAKAAWQQFTQCRSITCQVFDDSIVWIGTGECGLARFSPLSGQMSFLTNLNSGLPSNAATCLAIGRDHVLWIGTDEGLAAFDGRAWRIFTTGNAPFPANSVSSVACDSSGSIWVGFTGGGVLRHSSSGWTNLLETQPGFPLTLSSNTVFAIAPVNDHAAWISWFPLFTDAYGLAFFNESGWHAYGYRNIQSMAADKNGAVWFPVTEWAAGYNLGIARLCYPDSVTTSFAPASLVPTGTYSFSTVAIDRAGRKWTGAGNCVFCLDDTVWTRLPIIDDTATGASSITSIVFDKAGTAWAGFTYANKGPVVAGLIGDTAWAQYPVRGSDIPFNDLSFVCSDNNGGAWLFSGCSIFRFHAGLWERFSAIDGYPGAGYSGNICQDGFGGVWIAKYTGFVHVTGNGWKFLSISPMNAYYPIYLFQDDKGRLWTESSIASMGRYSLVAFDTLMNVVETIDPFPSFVIGIAQTTDGTLWVAPSDSGLLRRASNGLWSRMTTLTSNLPTDSLTGILAGPNGKLWAGTENRGLACLSNGQWTRYDTLNSDIPGQYTKPLCVDTFGNLWLLAQPSIKKCVIRLLFPASNPEMYCYETAVQNGLVKFDGLHWTVYNTINSGLPSNVINAVAAGDSGRIWVGTDKGLAIFNANKDPIYPGLQPHAKGGIDGSKISIHVRNGIVTLHAPLPDMISALVFNAAGRKVFTTGDASAANGKAAISLPCLSPGFYIARMTMRRAGGQSAVVQKHFVVPGN